MVVSSRCAGPQPKMIGDGTLRAVSSGASCTYSNMFGGNATLGQGNCPQISAFPPECDMKHCTMNHLHIHRVRKKEASSFSTISLAFVV